MNLDGTISDEEGHDSLFSYHSPFEIKNPSHSNDQTLESVTLDEEENSIPDLTVLQQNLSDNSDNETSEERIFPSAYLTTPEFV